MPVKCISLVLMCILSCPVLAEEGDNQLSKGVSVVKFIPGLPQIISGKVLRGSILLGACLSSIAGAVWQNQKGNRYYEQYLASTVVEEVVDLRTRAEKCYRARNYCLIGMVSVWIIHFLDLKFLKNKKGEVKGEVKNNRLCIGIYYSF